MKVTKRTRSILSLVLMTLMLSLMLLPAGVAYGIDLKVPSGGGTSNICKSLKDMKRVGGTGPTDYYIEVDLHSKVKTFNEENAATKAFTCTQEGIKFNQDAFNNGTEKSKKEVMSTFVTATQNSGLDSQSQQRVFDQLSAVDSSVQKMLIPIVMDSTSADLYTALRIASPFLPVVRVVFGLGAIGISIVLIASTIADLAFIGLPMFRDNLQQNADNKGKGIPFISGEAISVINETAAGGDTSGGYKNAYWLYFKRRVMTYIIIGICLLYLVLGELSGFMSWLLTLGEGLVQ